MINSEPNSELRTPNSELPINLHLSLKQAIIFTLSLVSTLILTNSSFYADNFPIGVSCITDECLTHPSVLAQSLSPERVSEMLYQKNSSFPLENNYKSAETGEIATENTLITRIVRYHQYVKARPTRFRLDWKLTLADYLGKNEVIIENNYPGYKTLDTSPLPQDRQVIKDLTMEQRDTLVNTLVSIYNPASQSSDESESKPQPTMENKPDSPQKAPIQLPQKGGAELLLP